MSRNNHHIFCNYWATPVETCRLCKRLNRDYPPVEEKDLVEFYFPDVEVRGDPN
jgi:hypothetical protein